ncbi:scavenger receptor class B member 1 isoform X2 [Halyomorpha halys]|uniref:scavenger receptor class B member 1 isoform X2 n=1 Tax=Halyomorpha halys TaxID=286706 RepID=UPI0034D28683
MACFITTPQIFTVKSTMECFLFKLSLFLFSTACVIILSMTEIYETAILQVLTLEEGGVVYDIWKSPSTEMNIRIYPFNYTNIDRIGEEKPHVKELGPYVFKERLQKINITFNDNGTLTYSENRTHEFDPTLSNGALDDVIYTPNVPFMSAAAQGAEKGVLTQIALAAFLKGLDTRPFLPVNILEFADGFDDDFSTVARKLTSILKGKTPPKFGMLAGRTGVKPDKITIGTGMNDLDNFGSVSAYDGQTILKYWKTEECNKITGSDGNFFPPRIVQKKSRVHIYIASFCRRIPLVYNGTEKIVNDFPSKRFEVPLDVFSTPEENPDNACFCEKKKCEPSGTFSTSKCNFGAPVSISLPHFLNGDKELRTNVTGLNPDLEKHKFYMDLHSIFGLPMSGRMRFQINVVVHHCPFLTQLKDIPDGTILPIAWMEIGIGEVQGFAKDVIYHATYTAYYLKQLLLWSSFGIMLLTFFCLCISLRKNNKIVMTEIVEILD